MLAICLGINDDLNKLFKRKDDLKAHKRPEPFVSCFHTDYASYNLNYTNVNMNPNIKTDNSYNETKINTGKTDTFNNNSGNSGKVNNPNLIDFNFSNNNNTGNSQPVINSNQNKTINTGNNPIKKINDINDIFDAFNNK